MGKNVVDQVRARASRSFSHHGTGHKFISNSAKTRVSLCATLTEPTMQESATIFRYRSIIRICRFLDEVFHWRRFENLIYDRYRYEQLTRGQVTSVTSKLNNTAVKFLS